ncbi:coenzyme Q-binding protein Coq10p, mitochondrial [[Candida] railenensis]|uniref:Coenzyme Q-binding protein Coq10p, mitochondrial n=1 Tax=[Candida] railenensis TaxID=45579 RepID=A0A9P0QTY7_9ASCO|nr:coenzyme Q-binding protein Coq10p, mitochondrial [[Candida] railenensis]
MLVRGSRYPFLSRRSFFSFPGTNSVQTYQVKKRLNFPPSTLFEIVSSVDKYNEFVPFVTESFVNKRDSKTGNPTEAGLRVGWQQFDEIFTCNLKCETDKCVIAESLTVSLFDKLHTEWKFTPIENPHIKQTSCQVELNLTYSFKNPLYNTVSSLFSEQVTQLMLRAFESRARELRVKEVSRK